MKAVRGAEGGVTRGRPGDGLAAARIPDDPEIARTVIMHRFPLEEAVEALRAASDKASKAIRIVIEPSWHPSRSPSSTSRALPAWGIASASFRTPRNGHRVGCGAADSVGAATVAVRSKGTV